jgi:poly-beta-hydroxybutyrate-responsive repressor
MARQAKRAATHAAGDMLTAHLLAMLKGWSAYGYDLAQRLEEAGLGEYNKGTIYRTLRQMEAVGLVSSMWDTSMGGPARRMYSLTGAGSMFLENWLAVLDAHKAIIEHFLEDARSRDTDTEEDSPAPPHFDTETGAKTT